MLKAFNKSPHKPKLIFAFEPSSYVYSILKLTVSRFKNVQCFKLAFDSKNGTTTLNMPIKKSGSIRVGLSHIGKVSEGDYLKEVVDTKILDDFAERMRCDTIDLIKIDVEGAEFEILKGASRILTEVRPFWFAGAYPKHMRNRSDLYPCKTCSSLAALGFISTTDRPPWHACTTSDWECACTGRSAVAPCRN